MDAVQTQIPDGVNNDIWVAIKNACVKFEVNYSDESVQEHYNFLASVGLFAGCKNEFHMKGRAEIYAKFYGEAGRKKMSRPDARQYAYEKYLEDKAARDAKQPKDLSELGNEESEQPPHEPTEPRKKSNGSAPKPKPATTTPPAQQTPQDAPHETERAPVESEAAGSIEDAGESQSESKTHKEIAAILYGRFEKGETSTDPRGYEYTQEKYIVKRLNQAFGLFGWQVRYSEGNDGRVTCAIGARIDGEWLWRENGTAMMKEDDPGIYKDGKPIKTRDDIAKTAYTDAFKRAARMWGIGYYLLKD